MRIIYLDGNMDIFTNVTSLTIDDGAAKVTYGGGDTYTSLMSVIDEITIKPNL